MRGWVGLGEGGEVGGRGRFDSNDARETDVRARV